MSESKIVGDILRKREKNGSFEFTTDCIMGLMYQAGVDYSFILMDEVMEDIKTTHNVSRAPQRIEEMGALGPRYKAVKIL